MCLLVFQGVGIGNAMSEFVASLFAATGKPYVSTTSHPAMIRHRALAPVAHDAQAVDRDGPPRRRHGDEGERQPLADHGGVPVCGTGATRRSPAI